MYNLVESVFAALAAIRAHALRSILTTLGIIIGVAAVIAVVSVIQGFSFMISNIFQGLGTNSVVIYAQANRAQYQSGIRPRITPSDLMAIKQQVGGLENISPILYLANYGGKITYQGSSTTGRIVGGTASYVKARSSPPGRGRFIVPADNIHRRRVCVIGVTIIKNLGIKGNPVGQYLEIKGEWFRIVGVLKKLGEFFGQDRDDIVIIPYETARSIMGAAQKTNMFINVSVQNLNRVPAIVTRIKHVLTRNHRLHHQTLKGIRVQTASQFLNKFKRFFNTFTFILGGIVMISLIVGGIGIMNIMLVSVTERTREIGILKSLGARRRDILLQFLIEAITLSVLGGAIGIGLGWLLGSFATHVIPGLTATHVPPWAIVIAFGFSVATGVIFGIIPAAKAAGLRPIDALRYE